MENSLIYKITNPEGRVYIGQAKNWIGRLSRYRRLNCKTQPIIYNSLKKYGYTLHQFEIIEYCESQDILNEREMYYIEVYKSNNNRYPENNGMNCNDGGGTSFGFKHTEETKEKLRKLGLGKKHTEETKIRMSDNFRNGVRIYNAVVS